MRAFGSAACCAAMGVLLIAGTTLRASPTSDDFNDNATGPQWTVLADDPAHLALAEQNQRLEALASAPASSHTDALYLSNGPQGFALSTAADFHITLNYNFSQYRDAGSPGDAPALDFGVGRDLAGTDSAAIGYGYANSGAIAGTPLVLSGATIAHRSSNVETTDLAQLVTAPTGTFDIAYDAAGDNLTLSMPGTTATYTLANTVRGVWGADSLLVSFGARGNGFTTASGDAWMDNFNLISGQTVPEPACLGFTALALLLVRRRRKIGASQFSICNSQCSICNLPPSLLETAD